MNGLAFLVIALIGLVVAHLAATASKVLRDISWHELQAYARNRRRSRFDEIHEECDEVAIGVETLLYLAIVVHALAGVVWTSRTELLVFASVFDFTTGVAMGTIVLLAAVVWFPIAISELAGTRFLYQTWPIWKGVSLATKPLAWGASGAMLLLRRVLESPDEADDEAALEEEIRSIVAEGQQDGLLGSDTRDMIEGVIELDDANVADIMTPHDDMDTMSVHLNWSEILAYVTEVGRTRIPVFDEGPDDFVGVLYVKDLFAELVKPESDRMPFRDLLRQKWIVPTTMHLDELLQQFRSTRNHLALVVDEYYAVTGLVTIEDVLEEIVGEIMDESDDEDDLVEISVAENGDAIVPARTHVQEVNERLGCNLPEDDEFDTIGGFLMHHLGRIPRQGDQVEWNGLCISILRASIRRAELVKIVVID